MKAKFIFEKFIEDSDPIHDLGIGLKGMSLLIPSEWSRKDRDNTLFRRKNYKTRQNPATYAEWNVWKIVNAKRKEFYIEVDLKNNHSKLLTSHLLLTKRQFLLFAKKYQKYQKLHNESRKST